MIDNRINRIFKSIRLSKAIYREVLAELFGTFTLLVSLQNNNSLTPCEMAEFDLKLFCLMSSL